MLAGAGAFSGAFMVASPVGVVSGLRDLAGQRGSWNVGWIVTGWMGDSFRRAAELALRAQTVLARLQESPVQPLSVSPISLLSHQGA
ncbi:hypothetical protein C664_14773 [Thauera sp. 63]|nr:hypothetical protein C664_14773 [Thauera sp. 63]